MSLRTRTAERTSLPPLAQEDARYYESSRRLYGSRIAASIYDVVTYPLHGLRRRVVHLSGITRGMRVLDVATGTGAQARVFGDLGASVVGVDLSPHMLANARRKNRNPEVTFLEADATALPVGDSSFDAACVSLALHEMPATMRVRVLAELVRVTRPGGTIVVVEPALPRNRIWRAIVERVRSQLEPEYYVDFVHSDLHDLLARSGLPVLAEHEALLGTVRIVIGRRSTAR